MQGRWLTGATDRYWGQGGSCRRRARPEADVHPQRSETHGLAVGATHEDKVIHAAFAGVSPQYCVMPELCCSERRRATFGRVVHPVQACRRTSGVLLHIADKDPGEAESVDVGCDRIEA